MRLLATLFLLISINTFSQQDIKSDVIVISEIFIDEAEGGSFFIVYTDSKDSIHMSDMRFLSEDIIVSDKILFDFQGYSLLSLDEEYAKELIGEKITMNYYEKEISYFGVVPYVISLEKIK